MSSIQYEELEKSKDWFAGQDTPSSFEISTRLAFTSDFQKLGMKDAKEFSKIGRMKDANDKIGHD